jgi:hypothetical protein
MIPKHLQLAYRLMRVALVLLCFSLAFTIYDHYRQVAHDKENLSESEQRLATTAQLLSDARQQRDLAREQLTQAQKALATAEKSKAAVGPP